MKCLLLRCKNSNYDGIEEGKIYVAIKKDEDVIIKINKDRECIVLKEENHNWFMVDSFDCNTEEELNKIIDQVEEIKGSIAALVFGGNVLTFKPMEIDPDMFSIPKDMIKPIKVEQPIFNVNYERRFLKK